MSIRRAEAVSGNPAQQPYEIGFIGGGIETLSQLVVTVATERSQAVVSYFEDVPVVALPGDDREAVAQRWLALSLVQEQN